MALVAYSDESDFSDNEEENTNTNIIQSKVHLKSNTINNSVLENNSNICSSKDEVKEDGNADDDLEVPVSSLLAVIPRPQNLSGFKSKLDVSEETDIVDDVPTVKTWDITKDIKKIENSNLVKEKATKKAKDKPVRTKLRLVLPSLSEFDDEEEEEDEEESKRKKIRPCGSGTGLFAVLPKPRGPTSLIPQSVGRKRNIPPLKPKKVVTKSTQRPTSNVDSDEEDLTKTSNNDFFSLSDSPVTVPEFSSITPNLHLPIITPQSPSFSPPELVITEEITVLEQEETEAAQPLFIPFANTAENSTGHGIEEEALRRLAGGRNKGEIPTIIDIKADDALMTREEWVTRALCDEKPKKSFSNKKEGNPTQQQKRKHQITYLAHQAQEREKDLQNNWGQNRFTKMQTRSKYGF